ncbi:MAG: prolipoprotein diacylglyceryl transferase, partial [Dermatophilaceae bacterium]
GRIVIERMRTDEAEVILGQRLNVWTSIVVFLLGVWIIRHTAGRARRFAADEVPRDGGPDDATRDGGPDDVTPDGGPDDASPVPDDGTRPSG